MFTEQDPCGRDFTSDTLILEQISFEYSDGNTQTTASLRNIGKWSCDNYVHKSAEKVVILYLEIYTSRSSKFHPHNCVTRVVPSLSKNIIELIGAFVDPIIVS